MASVRQVILHSNDGTEFKVDFKVACMSKTIERMLEHADDDDDSPAPLPNVDGKTLEKAEKVLKWCEQHKDDPKPELPLPEPMDEYRNGKDKGKRDDLFSTWDADFVKVEEEIIYDLTLAANYLEIDGLLELTCKVIANTLRGKTPEWCRERFGIVNDFTEQESEQIRKENEWCEDK